MVSSNNIRPHSVRFRLFVGLPVESFLVLINEPRHDKTKKVTVRPAKTQISLASAQSDQSPRCALNG